ncbi:acyl-CoA--6-aminopenicillanic acid acyltransferase [Paucisalibacillus globulus]|uniref:acyl-CoA--6-aminopenicillanic acid acyltransferase n=1 Tax=Paucisalibacillus globulus TaxID=351095 RepID=UPI00041FFB36|nr:acyl-CoA--6-aminopenicillanic acid acyltransferase [Paucisalibacillus globulus]
MRQKLFVNLVELVGSNYQIGMEQSNHIKFDEKYDMFQKLTSTVDSTKAQSILMEYSDGIIEEIRGIADGLKIDFQTALRMYSGYDLTFPTMGCTAFSKENYYIRNYDFSPELYDGRLAFYNPEYGYASIGFSQQIIGRLDGMNEHGLVIGLHLVNEAKWSPGLMGTTIVRLVLDTCKDVGEAVNIITKLPHGYCYNYSLMDQDGNTCMVEASPEEQVVTHHTPLICTNHFETETLSNKNRTYIEGSLRRKNYLQELALETYSPEEAYQLFNNENSPLFFKEYRQFFGTLHTVIYIPKTLEVIVGIGGNATPTRYSLAKWLQGDQHVKGELVGEIDY